MELAMEKCFISYTEAFTSNDPLSNAILQFSSEFKPSSEKKYIFRKNFAIDCVPLDRFNKENFGTFFIATSDSGICDSILNSSKIHINLYDKLYKVNFSYNGCNVERLR